MESIDKYLSELQQQSDELSSDVQKTIILYIKMNPYKTYEDLLQFLAKAGFTQMTSEDNIFKLLTTYVNGVGKHIHVPDETFDSNELEMGIEVEKEHTDCPILAKEISKDHLAECPDYYTRLKRMEDECKNRK